MERTAAAAALNKFEKPLVLSNRGGRSGGVKRGADDDDDRGGSYKESWLAAWLAASMRALALHTCGVQVFRLN